MFKKKKCEKCGEKINSKHRFCPNCGNLFNSENENWGMLGKTDETNEFEQFSNSLFGGGMLGKMLGRTMKILEREMQNQNSMPETNFELIINGKRINPKNIRISHQPMQKQFAQKMETAPQRNFSNENLKKISGLPKQEPLTKIRRLLNKVVYEIEMPGVKSIKDVSIIKLENSIEIKALAKDKAYFKLIPINLPIINYNLSKGKLILELEARN